MHKIILTSIVALVILSALLILAQVWGVFIGTEIFVKLLITIGIVVAVLAFLLIVKGEFGEHKKLKDDNYID